jgi:serine phosphatase RsbU (regulator of sigma subunit)
MHTILCIDDEPIILNSLKRELMRAFPEYNIEVAESAEEALEVVAFLQSRGQAIAMAISDYVMPQMKGDELLIKLHQLSPDTIKILLTGQASVEGITNIINEANLYRFIAKPWEPNDLRITVEKGLKSFQQDLQLSLQNAQLRELNHTLEQKVAERTKTLEEQHKAIQDSIHYARNIQRSILPPTHLLEASFKEHFVFYRPRDVVSGDFYWMAQRGHKTIFVAADCTGHGVPGAFMSMIGVSLLNQAIHDAMLTQPESILSEVDYNLQTVWKYDQQFNKDGMDMMVCTIDTEAKTLSCAGARSRMTYFQAGQIHTIKGEKSSIGDLSPEQEIRKHFTRHTIDISSPTMLYLYSDGYQDQFGGAEDKKFLPSRLNALFEAIHQQPTSEQQAVVAQTFEDWKGSRSQIDDVMVIGLRL